MAFGSVNVNTASGATIRSTLPVEVTLRADAWEGESAPYTQQVDIGTYLSDNQYADLCDLEEADAAQRAAYREAVLQITAHSGHYVTVTADGTKPETDITAAVLVHTTLDGDFAGDWVTREEMQETEDYLDGRVSNVINELTENPDYAPTAEVVDIRTGRDGTVYDTAGDAVRAIGEELDQLSENVADFVRKGAVDGLYYEDSMLFLTANGELVGDGVEIVSGSGGSSGSASIVKLINESESTAFSVASGSPVSIAFRFTSVEDEVPTGNGSCKVMVNGALKATLSIPQGSNVLPIGSYLNDGGNTVRITCTDVYGVSRSLTYSINVIALSISSTFDDSLIYDGDITVKFTPVGLVEKTVYFQLDGVVVDSVTSSASGKQSSKVFSALPHGSHKMVIWMEATIDGANVESNRLVYDIISIESGEDGVIVASPFEGGTITQGELVEIPFSVYDPSSMTADVTVSILQNGAEYSSQSLSVDRTRQTWSTRNYPTGTVVFRITSGSVSKTFTMTVEASNIPVEAETEDLTLHLSAAGRSNSEANPAVWTDGETTTTFRNVSFVNNGWIADDEGDTVLRLNGEAKAIINMMPFASDARLTGKTIELEFAIRDVSNRDAVAISCMSGGIGFESTADRTTLKSEQSSVECRYKDGERIRVAFTIESRSEYRLMNVYLNGVLSGTVQYPESDNFQQPTPVGITLGSEYCSVDIYTIRAYDTALNKEQVRDNYIADTMNLLEKQRLYEANNIYDEYGSLSFDALVDKIPVMTIIGQLPTFKGDKQDVMIEYTDPSNPSLNFTDSCKIDVQGTSSQWYIRKNYKLKFPNSHKHHPDQMAAKVFCMKADYAEATGTHNTGCANYVHTLYGDVKTPPQQENALVRTTVFGFPCVIFHKENDQSTPEFIGKYNFNFDKGSENIYGFSEDYPKAESWEFSNNTSDHCLFHADIDETWADNFEARYPDEYGDISAFAEMHRWVVSTYQDAATGDALAEPYTDVDGNTHTNDTAAYRLAKFKTEFTDHFDMGFSLLYYVFTLTMLMVDQRAKNMFLTTWDGVHWEPWLYDNDTCLGINNEGQLVFDYYHEDIDQLGSKNVYNGQTSTLWVNFRQAFGDEIKSLYQTLRSSGKITYQVIYDWFVTNHADKWSASVYNEDSDYKYVSMLRSDGDASNLSQIRGTGKEHLGYFVDARLAYLDSKFYAMDYANDYATLRIYTPETYAGVEPNADITVTPYSNMYAGVRYKANGTLQQLRAEKNTPVTFKAPAETFNDTETAVFGAKNISSLGDLSPLYCGSVNVASATKLKELIVGSSAAGYQNTNLVELSVGTNKLLRLVNVTNCPNLVAPLNLAGCPNIEEVYAKGSGITAVNLPAAGYLKRLYLPATITNLTLLNQKHIEEFSCDGYGSLTTLRVENTDNVDLQTIIDNAPNLNRVRLIGIDCSFDDASTLLHLADNTSVHGLDESGNNLDTAVVTGRAYIGVCNATALATIRAAFPYLEVTYGALTYTVTFMNEGVLHATQEVVSGQNALSPAVPTKPNTLTTIYIFDGWDGAITNITQDTTLNAVYRTTPQQYTIEFYEDENEQTLLQRVSGVAYGGAGTYTQEWPTKSGYIFDGWTDGTTKALFDAVVPDGYASLNELGLPNTIKLHASFSRICFPSIAKSFDQLTEGEKLFCSIAIQNGGADGYTVNFVSASNEYIITETATATAVAIAVGDEEQIPLSNGETLTRQVADFNHDFSDAEQTKPIGISYVMKNLLTATRVWNSAYKHLFNYQIGDEDPVVSDTATHSSASDAVLTKTHDVTADEVSKGYCDIKFLGETFLRRITLTHASGEQEIWDLDYRGFWADADMDTYGSYTAYQSDTAAVEGTTRYKIGKMLSSAEVDVVSNSGAKVSGWTATDWPVAMFSNRKHTFTNFGGIVIDCTGDDSFNTAERNSIFGNGKSRLIFSAQKAITADYTITEISENTVISVPVREGDIITVLAFGSSRTAGGFGVSDYHDWIENTFVKMLPIGVRNTLVQTYKRGTIGNRCYTVTETKCTAFPLSYAEVNGSSAQPWIKEGKRYPIFSNNASRIKYKQDGAGAVGSWWERSPHVMNYGVGYVYYVNTGGNPSSYYWAYDSIGVCLGFCSGEV